MKEIGFTLKEVNEIHYLADKLFQQRTAQHHRSLLVECVVEALLIFTKKKEYIIQGGKIWAPKNEKS